MPQAFISHSLEDALFAQQIANGLRDAGIEVWIAPDSIRPGEEFVDAIQRGLTHTTHFVLLMSPEAFISQWVKLEMNTAIRMEREGRMAITPILYRQCHPPLLLGNYQWMEYKNDATAIIQRLIQQIGPGEARPSTRTRWSEPRALTEAQAASIQQLLDEVAAEVAVCTLCPLHLNRKKTVPGAGHPGAQLMFIGEAPGPEDDKTGMPFVSPAGGILDELLSLIQLPRSHTWMTNIVKCRPPKKNGKNQAPSPAEQATCADYLDRQIEAINPRIIVTLGNHALARIAPDLDIKLSTHHGKPQRLGDAEQGSARILFPMYHPAAGIYESKYKSMLMQDFVDMDRYMVALPS